MSVAARCAVVRVDGDLTIAAAAEQAARLRQALPDGADLTLDLAAVGDCDSAGVQLLLALRRSLAQRGRRLHLAGLAESVDDALRTFGLHALFAAAADPLGADATQAGPAP